MKKSLGKKTILKDAGVLLIAAILVLTVLTSMVIVPMKAAQTLDHDAGVTGIISPTTGPVQTYPVEVTVENFGTNAETSVPVEVVIEKGGVVEYDQTIYIDINPGQSMNVSFPDWAASGIGEYQVTACTMLDTDSNPSNDCTSEIFYIAINIFGFNHIPLGDATLDVVDGKLIVSNIGTSGNDGVQVLLPKDLVDFKPYIEFAIPGQDMSLEITSKGIIDGVPDQVATITSFDFTDGGKNISMTFDTSALQPEYILAHYYINGSPIPIHTEKIPIGGNKTNPTCGIALATAVTGTVPKVEFISAGTCLYYEGPYSQSLSNLEDNGICGGMDLTGGSGNFSTLDGSIVKADSVLVYPQLCTRKLTNYTDVELKATAIDPTSISLTIADEKVLFNQTKLNPPEMTGSTSGKILKKYDYTASTIDPQGGIIYYWFYWGDNTSSGWLGPYTSGAQATASHIWTKKGTYLMGAIAKNIDGFDSGFGVLDVTMPRTYTYNPLILRLFERFPNAFPILRHLMGLY